MGKNCISRRISRRSNSPGESPLICTIQRFSLDDGPGIRTTVFCKGCPLSCDWCHNPESMRPEATTAFYPERCILCGSCKTACPEDAITADPIPRIDRSRCTDCGSCADRCPALAIRTIGKAYSPGELLEVLLRDKHFFEASGGGVTFSGGEPTLRMAYLGDALRAVKSAGLHTAIQTCGMFDYDSFSRRVLPFLDLIMFDLKLIEPAEHRRYTGRGNRTILKNFKRLTGEAGDRVQPRVPLVPGITATFANLLGIASFLSDLGYHRSDLLPYNPAGIAKRRAIGMDLPSDVAVLPLAIGEENRLRELFFNRLG